MKKVDPIEYFQECMLEESLLIKLSFLPDLRVLDFVSDYAADVLLGKLRIQDQGKLTPIQNEQMRDFRHIVFQSITEMQRNGVALQVDHDSARFHLDLKCGPIVVTEAICIAQDAGYQMTISLGRFGRYVFSFLSLLVDQRLGIAKQLIPGIWEYSDANTGMVFKFENPFPDDLQG